MGHFWDTALCPTKAVTVRTHSRTVYHTFIEGWGLKDWISEASNYISDWRTVLLGWVCYLLFKHQSENICSPMLCHRLVWLLQANKWCGNCCCYCQQGLKVPYYAQFTLPMFSNASPRLVTTPPVRCRFFPLRPPCCSLVFVPLCETCARSNNASDFAGGRKQSAAYAVFQEIYSVFFFFLDN